jgi:hypothetical protein
MSSCRFKPGFLSFARFFIFTEVIGMLNAALFHAARGWSVIPLRPRDKRPALSSWADYQSRRATEEEIREWWDRWPNANIGLVTGAVSGLIVLDLDGPEAADLAKRQGVPPTVIATTGKGWHVYFTHPGQPVQNAASLNGVKGLDLRGDGGYVVAPPSVHPSGRRYTWAKGRSPDDLPLAPCPEWLLKLLETRNQKAIKEPKNNEEPGWVETLLRGVPEGQRDDAATRLAGHFLGKGLPESEVIALLLTWNQRNQPPLTGSQIEKCVRSVANREARKPNRPRAQVFPGGFRLEGPVHIPAEWHTLIICRDWAEARKLAAAGNAVAVCRKDGTLPPEAGRMVAAAKDVKTVGFTQEEARRLAWQLYPLRLIRAGAATDGTAALKPEVKPELEPEGQVQAAEPVAEAELPQMVAEPKSDPESKPAPTEPPPAQEPVPPPAQDPTANRFHLECWLAQHRPDLLAAIRRAVDECERMDWYAQAGFPEKLAAAEAALAQAVEAGQQAMREALAAGREEAGPEEALGLEVQKPGRELTFVEVERVFGGFERVWRLTDAQTAHLEKIFRFKGPVVVRSENGLWWSAEDWRS